MEITLSTIGHMQKCGLYRGSIKRRIEATVLRDAESLPFYAIDYIRQVTKSPFPAAEPLIAAHPKAANRYATEVIKGRWEPGEAAIAQDGDESFQYAVHCLKNQRFLLGEPAIINDFGATSRINSYIANVIKGRWPEAEWRLAQDDYWWGWYVAEYFDNLPGVTTKKGVNSYTRTITREGQAEIERLREEALKSAPNKTAMKLTSKLLQASEAFEVDKGPGTEAYLSVKLTSRFGNWDIGVKVNPGNLMAEVRPDTMDRTLISRGTNSWELERDIKDKIDWHYIMLKKDLKLEIQEGHQPSYTYRDIELDNARLVQEMIYEIERHLGSDPISKTKLR